MIYINACRVSRLWPEVAFALKNEDIDDMFDEEAERLKNYQFDKIPHSIETQSDLPHRNARCRVKFY